MHEENLSQFSSLAAETLDEFWSSVTANSAEGEESSAAAVSLPVYLGLLQRIQDAAAATELLGLQSICAMLQVNLQAILDAGRELTVGERLLLEEWPELLMGFMIGQADRAASAGMVKNLQSAAWPLPISVEEGNIILDMLGFPPTGATDSLPPGEQPVPLPDEFSADVPSYAIADTDCSSGQAAEIEVLPEARNHADTPSLADVSSFADTSSSINITDLPADSATQPPIDHQIVDSEMIAMLNNEFALMDRQLNEDLDTITGSQYSTQEQDVALGNYIDLVERLGMASESVGLIALSRLFLQLKQMLVATGTAISPEQRKLLEQLPGRISAYLTWPSDSSSCSGLLDLLSDRAWDSPIAEEAVAGWVAALANVTIEEGAEQKQVRQAQATEEDVSLALPDDINAELLDGLLQELPMQTSAFTAAIGRISAGQGSASDISRAMRAAHTLKGAANTVGVKGIANLTHHLEDILVALADGAALPNAELAATLVSAADCLEAMSETLMGVGPAPEQARDVLQGVLDYANRIDQEGIAAVASADVPAIQQEDGSEEDTGSRVSAPEQAQGMRVAAPVVEELLRLAGETLISNSQIQDRLRQTAKQAEALKHQQQLVGQLVVELESLVDIRGVAAPHQKMGEGADFDPLEFDNYSELHTVSRRLIEASADAQQIMAEVSEQFDTMSDLLEIQQRLQMENQHAVISTRLVPVSGVVSRLQRSVRQTCRLLDKQVDLHITGETTSIDSNVLTELIDPLMHILRNSVDHGIEPPQQRAAAGKSTAGRIDLSFSREGNSIVVRCKDDGVGLDYEAIKRIAESKGMIAPERNPTQEELARLILVNGFSTRDEATQVSGRGVGMDVVYNRVLQMKGVLSLNSERGRGLTVELRLPATLLSAHSLIVRHGDKLIAVSSRGVEDIHYVTVEQVEYIGTQPVYRVDNAVHNLIRLESLLGFPGDRREHERLGFPVLLTRMEDGAIKAIVVQEILDGRDVVLKNFGRYVPKIHGVIGAVILGDGSVAPVVDIVELLRVPMQSILSEQMAAHKTEESGGDFASRHLALVVDDSLTARRAAAKVLKDAGYTVRTAIDGLEAVSILKNFMPDVLLVDMEMPRMNGLELTAHMRNAERTRHVPVIMITSRSTEKHRKQAKSAGVDVYLTKPFVDEVLLNHVVRLAGK